MSKIVTARPSFQGDLMLRRIDRLPSGLKGADAIDGKLVVAHSETGHDHVIDSRNARMLIDATNAFIAYLDVGATTELTHMRSFDTHAPLTLEPGLYEVRRQREYVPEGFRRAED